jgi:hypothetical protein
VLAISPAEPTKTWRRLQPHHKTASASAPLMPSKEISGGGGGFGTRLGDAVWFKGGQGLPVLVGSRSHAILGYSKWQFQCRFLFSVIHECAFTDGELCWRTSLTPR